jgi:chemotaxis signal transduction protein
MHSGCKETGQGICEVQINELEILVFALGGITFGVDTEQVGGVITAAQAEILGMKLIPFPDRVPLGGMPGHFRAPKALLIKDVTSYAVVIESPDDILSVRLDSIRPLPPLLAACNPCQAVWGVAVKGEGIILLIDFLRLHDVHDQNEHAHTAYSNKAGEATT